MSQLVTGNEDVLEKFFSNARKTSYCWIWKGALDYDGYAAVHINEREMRAIQHLYRLLYGTNNHLVALKLICHDLRCVNPDHVVARSDVAEPATLSGTVLPPRLSGRKSHPRGKKLSFEEYIRRFWQNVHKTDSCWEWRGTTDYYGYGRYYASSPYSEIRTTIAHRIAFIIEVSDIPEGLELDHLCRNRPCVNPAHLEPVTGQENKRRAAPFKPKIHYRRSYAQIAKLHTHCRRGHEYTDDNTRYQYDKKYDMMRRACRACIKAKRHAYYERTGK
jgi:HNH endonuclease